MRVSPDVLLFFEPEEIICTASQRSREPDNGVTFNALAQPLLDLQQVLLM
jgi:hypothetical protein